MSIDRAQPAFGRSVGPGGFMVGALLVLVYVVVVPIAAVVVNLIDPLTLRSGSRSGWRQYRGPFRMALDDARRQF